MTGVRKGQHQPLDLQHAPAQQQQQREEKNQLWLNDKAEAMTGMLCNSSSCMASTLTQLFSQTTKEQQTLVRHARCFIASFASAQHIICSNFSFCNTQVHCYNALLHNSIICPTPVLTREQLPVMTSCHLPGRSGCT